MLKNKLALVTGANRGIGLSILKKFSENGANIIACTRERNEKFEELILDISKKHKNKIIPIYFDLSKENEIEQGIKKINSLSDNVEIIVNNAGINQVSLFQMTPIEKIKEIFDINFFSHLRLTQKLMKIMIKNKKGSIINISSNAAQECDAGRVGYASSKAALVAFTKVLSKELGNFNIRVNAVAPGLTNTEMMKKDISEKIIEEAIKKTALKRPAEAEEISNTVMFLASDLSRYITGEVIFVTGGY
jgi:3-oxoacyl-[acyl-carrier protein] reductase|tara:strand:- start:1763 stop:2503 length:741 start_codon:yes stop_codon:yes gene_type:complete